MFFLALLSPYTKPEQIVFQSSKLMPMTKIQWVYVDDYYYIHKVIIGIGPLLTGLSLIVLLWPFIKKTALEINNEIGCSYSTIVYLLLIAQIPAMSVGSINDLTIIIEFLTTHLSNLSPEKAIIKLTILLVVVGVIGIFLFLVVFLAIKKVIEPRINLNYAQETF